MRRTVIASMIGMLALGVFAVRLVGDAAGEDRARPAADLHGRHIMLPADELEYKDGPPSLPPGAKYAVLEGDPASEAMYTIRIKLPAGYRIPPHTHPMVERATVLAGTFKLGMGRLFDEQNMQWLKQGSFFTMPPGMEHYAMTGDAETVLQFTCMGPSGIEYVNPADDPRKR